MLVWGANLGFFLAYLCRPMLGYISKLFGGSKSEKDVRNVQPLVASINRFFEQYQSLSNDQLRAKTQEFRSRIQSHLEPINAQINTQTQEAESLPSSDLTGRDTIYQEVDKLKIGRAHV